MYNRYIRNDQGGHTRVSQESSPVPSPPRSEQDSATQGQPERGSATQAQQRDHSPPPPVSPREKPSGTVPQITDSLTSILRHALDRLHMDHVDTGDLLLLGLLFFLFREEADEELLVALGLLLIL